MSKVIALVFVLLLMMVFTYSQPESSQQVTLSCPAPSENNRGLTGAPGKRGAEGQRGRSTYGCRGKTIV